MRVGERGGERNDAKSDVACHCTGSCFVASHKRDAAGCLADISAQHKRFPDKLQGESISLNNWGSE